MASPPQAPQLIASPDGKHPKFVRYHCVCGAITPICSLNGGRCDSCGRKYSPQIASLAASETICMPLASEIVLPEAGSETDTDATHLFPGNLADLSTTTSSFSNNSALPEVILPPDHRLGHFQIVGRLGRGGMGDVFRALDESLQRYVAIKLLRPFQDEQVIRKEAIDRLLEEARAQARVNHPGVVHIYYVSPDSDQPFLAMELVNGGSLVERIRDHGISYAETVDIGIQIASALAQAARFDVIHGDIKPANILVTEDEQVKLGDFGLARRLSQRQSTSPGGLTGTPNYLAPEVAAGAEPDHRSDMYSLGVMLFEMTFGRRPYKTDSGSLRDALEAHRSAPVEFPEIWPMEFPEGWRNVLSRLLEKSPERRYPNFQVLIDDLTQLRPVNFPSAGRVTRALSWAVDLFLASAAMTLLLAPYQFLSAQGFAPKSEFVFGFLALVCGALVMIVAAWLHTRWKSSPGKSMFQLRVVDRHGLSPGETPLAIRPFFQLLPMWADEAYRVFETLGVPNIGYIAAGTILAVSGIDAAFAVIRRDGRSIHDLLFMTRVVLDVPTAKSTT